MIKKPTIVLLIILAIVVGLYFLIPVLKGKEKSSDLIATPRPKLLAAIQAAGKLTLIENGAEKATIHQQNDGNWVVDFPTKGSITAGQVEQIFTELTAIEVVSPLLTPPPSAAVGLDAPKQVLLITSAEGKETQVKIGDSSPTGNGYYVMVDNASPVVVNKYGLDRVIEILNNLTPEEIVSTPAPAE